MSEVHHKFQISTHGRSQIVQAKASLFTHHQEGCPKGISQQAKQTKYHGSTLHSASGCVLCVSLRNKTTPGFCEQHDNKVYHDQVQRATSSTKHLICMDDNVGGYKRGGHVATRKRSAPGIEPGTSCTQSRNHTSRPSGLLLLRIPKTPSTIYTLKKGNHYGDPVVSS